MPAAAPKKKKIIINQGLVSNQLSKINPIIVPTETAAPNSVPNLKALPIKDPRFSVLESNSFFSFDFAIFRRVLKSSGIVIIMF